MKGLNWDYELLTREFAETLNTATSVEDGRRRSGEAEEDSDLAVRTAISHILSSLKEAQAKMAVRLNELDLPDEPTSEEGSEDLELQDVTRTNALLWRQLFLTARSPRVQLALFKEFGLGDRQLLWALPGLSGRTLRRWRSSVDVTGPPAARREQLDDVRAIVGLLLSDGSFDNEVIVSWLGCRQEALEMMRPLEAIGRGDFRDVLVAAEQFISPARLTGA